MIVRFRRARIPSWVERTVAEGGIRVKRGDYFVHTFTNDGVFVLSEATTVDLLVVGGGGGGAGGGGGGGGGSVIYLTNVVMEAGSYPVSIGEGGAGTPDKNSVFASSGSPSSFGSYLAMGGGAAGAMYRAGLPGGGGGGTSAGDDGVPTGHPGGHAIWGDTPRGGNGYSLRTTYTSRSLGGGGAGARGSGADAYIDGVWDGSGGPGVVCDISGEMVGYGGGGGGGGCGSGIYGRGRDGGADGSEATTTPTETKFFGKSANPNTGGGGGGGGSWSQKCGAGGHGGSGVVIVRYRRIKKGLTILFR